MLVHAQPLTVYQNYHLSVQGLQLQASGAQLSLSECIPFFSSCPTSVKEKKKKKGQTCICPGMFSKQGLQVENSYICSLNYGCLGHLKIHVG